MQMSCFRNPRLITNTLEVDIKPVIKLFKPGSLSGSKSRSLTERRQNCLMDGVADILPTQNESTEN